jgi:hypothetical protein
VSRLNEIECGTLCRSATEALRDATGGLRNFPALLKKIIRTKAWERREVSGRIIELRNLRELITEMPVRGWGEDPDKIMAIIRDDAEVLSAYREAMKHQGERRDFVDNVIEVDVKRPDGNSRAYSLSVVERSCDKATVAKVMKGQMSPHRALVNAGLRKVRQVYLPQDPQKAAEKVLKNFDVAYAQELARALLRACNGGS